MKGLRELLFRWNLERNKNSFTTAPGGDREIEKAMLMILWLNLIIMQMLPSFYVILAFTKVS
jgi:hypothetical protein